MDKKSGTNTPAISVPKGGGAIKGIGETFQPNIFMGTVSFSIPIWTSAGRNGFEPKLKLQYSTGNGNGPFGLGWRLSVSRITRKTEKGLPRYTEDDVFVLSEAEDLVPKLVKQGNQYVVDERPISFGDVSFRVIRYRPRTEGSFARVERWIRDDGDVHWRVTTKENVTSIYGKTQDARLFDQKHPEHVFEWLLQETFDSKGNHILYEYVKESPNLRIAEIYEENRQYNQIYIRRILYGNTPEALEDAKKVGPKRTGTHHRSPSDTKERHYLFEVLFDYGDLPDLPAIPFNPTQFPDKTTPDDWPLREDPFSSYRSGFEIRTLRRCRRVLMLHHFAEGELTGAPLVKSTD
ncbi:MAG: toxin, partial [Candidatus Bathyarchaeota archaeon]